jgi:hypothetical protein
MGTIILRCSNNIYAGINAPAEPLKRHDAIRRLHQHLVEGEIRTVGIAEMGTAVDRPIGERGRRGQKSRGDRLSDWIVLPRPQAFTSVGPDEIRVPVRVEIA